MSTLLADFFTTDVPIVQSFKIGNSINLYSMGIHLYKHGNLSSGNLNVKIFDNEYQLAEFNKTNTELNSLMGEYAHGYLRFKNDLRLSGRKNNESLHEYKVQATWSGYSLLLAWVMEYQNLIAPMYGSNQNNDAFKPKDLELFIWH
jgi:hypothetical protein